MMLIKNLWLLGPLQSQRFLLLNGYTQHLTLILVPLLCFCFWLKWYLNSRVGSWTNSAETDIQLVLKSPNQKLQKDMSTTSFQVVPLMIYRIHPPILSPLHLFPSVSTINACCSINANMQPPPQAAYPTASNFYLKFQQTTLLLVNFKQNPLFRPSFTFQP